MMKKQLLYLLILTLCRDTFQNIQDNLVEDDDTPVEDNQLKDLLNEDTLKNIGGVVKNFIASDGGKQIGDMLMGASNNNMVVSQILQGVGTLMQQNLGKSKSDKGETGLPGGINPELMGSLFNLMTQQKSDESEGLDVGSILQLVSGMSTPDSPLSYINLLPNLMQTFASFVGPEAKRREREHADHAWMFPPFVEKLHIFFDNFVNSEMGAMILESMGANKALKIFSDENGKFSYPKFVEMFENHSFRKHWISVATKKIATLVSYFADPYTQKKFSTTFQLFINNYLKGQGVPKTALFDYTRPTESLTALVNHFSKKYFGEKIQAKAYIQPAVAYVQELLAMAGGKSMNSELLSHKIADTVNLEIIEPVVRVNRAYRFATKVPKCDRYVMCLVNQKTPNEEESIPGLKLSLSKLASFVASWFLSDRGHTSFWSLYHVIMEEDNCRARYLDECNDFHIEEIRVTTEYIHNEL